MGLLDFLTGKSKAASTQTGRLSTAVAAEELKKEIQNQGLDASKIEIKIAGDEVTLGGSAPTQADIDKIVRAVETAKGVSRVENNIVASAPSEANFYIVQRGDTLWKIAETHYGRGKGEKYKDIFEANRPLLKNPDQIFPGQRLRIP